MQGWMDLAQLVSSAGGVKGAYEKLANKIGMPLRCIVVSAGCPGSDVDLTAAASCLWQSRSHQSKMALPSVCLQQTK